MAELLGILDRRCPLGVWDGGWEAHGSRSAALDVCSSHFRPIAELLTGPGEALRLAGPPDPTTIASC